MSSRRGYTLIELAMVAVVAAILAVFVFSDSDSSAKQEAHSASLCFESDVQYARTLSIAQPDDPVVIKVDAVNNKYWLARASSPDTPILHPQKNQPYVMQFGAAGPAGYKSVQIYATDFGGDQVLQFDATGSIDQQTPAVFQLTSGGAEYEVSVAPSSARTDVEDGFVTELTPIVGGGGTTTPKGGGTITPIVE